MMKLFPVIAALALLAFGPAPAQAADAGESDFKARCSACHKTPAMVVGFMKKHGDMTGPGRTSLPATAGQARMSADRAAKREITAFMARRS
jgi:mono/diheme cytochrome c family protein